MGSRTHTRCRSPSQRSFLHSCQLFIIGLFIYFRLIDKSVPPHLSQTHKHTLNCVLHTHTHTHTHTELSSTHTLNCLPHTHTQLYLHRSHTHTQLSLHISHTHTQLYLHRSHTHTHTAL